MTPKNAPKTRIYDPETDRYLKDSVVRSIEEAHEDMKHGRLKSYDSVDDMFQDLGINVWNTYRPHKLSGDYVGCWECHLKGDWLLIWEQDDTQLTLLFTGTGTHSDLF